MIATSTDDGKEPWADLIRFAHGHPSSEAQLLADLVGLGGEESTGSGTIPAHRRLEEVAGLVNRQIAAIDVALTEQLNAILHAPEFQRLEARWRGLFYVVNAASEAERVKVRFLDLSWRELVRDLERAADFDQSELFDKVYSEEFGTAGGEPYGLIIGDYSVRHKPSSEHPSDDVGALKSLASIGAAAFAPIVLGVDPELFQLESFRDLGRPGSLAAVFSQPEYARWLSARNDEDMRYIALALPRILMRRPYGADSRRSDGFPFVENVDDDVESYLWGVAAFAFASVVIRAFGQSGWFADLRGAPLDKLGGGLIADLTSLSFDLERVGVARKPSVEYLVTDSNEKELLDLGFIAVRDALFTDFSVFYSITSLEMPKTYKNIEANESAKLSVMLQYTLCVSRFAHYIKILGRDRIGTNMTAEECEAFLNQWLRQYCASGASEEVKRRCPLREGRVDVRERPSKPGSYYCSVYLRPQYQLDDIAAGFKLTTELAPRQLARVS